MTIANTLKQFIEFYETNLEEHKYKYEDNCELTFLGEQLYLYKIHLDVCEYILYDKSHLNKDEIDNMEELKNIVEKDVLPYYTTENTLNDPENWDRLHVSTHKIIKYIEQRKEELEAIGPENTINTQNIKTLNWQGTTLEFSEFTKALIESGFIGKVKSEKEVFERMKHFFNIKDFDKSEKLKQVRNRTKELTPTINMLETSLTNWIKRKD